MRISTIDWGEDSAEKDPNLLDYFVPTPAYEKLMSFSTSFIVGRKGSGKSALRKKLVEDISGYSDHFCLEVSPKFNVIRNIISDRDIESNFNEEIFFQYVWLNHLYKEALLAIGKSSKNTGQNPSFNYAKDFAKANERSDKSLLDATVELLNRIKVKAGKLGDLGIAIESILKKESEVEVYEYHISNILANGFKITWVVDDLDLGWNNSRVANTLLLGLLTCLNYLKALSQGYHIFICLREDVYRILLTQTQHSDKYRNIAKIRWTNEGLISLLNSRIRYNYHRNGLTAPDDPFHAILPETVSTSNTSNWIFERTLRRPRELIQLVRLYTNGNDTDIPSGEILKEIELEYSNWKLEDLCTEYSNQFPNLVNAFSTWKTRHFRNKYNLNKTEISDIIFDIFEHAHISDEWFATLSNNADIDGFLKIIYEIGFIGDFIQGGEGGSKTCYSFLDVHEPLFQDVQIHPCFRKAMGTVERIRNRTNTPPNA